jgi:hypothetical protein
LTTEFCVRRFGGFELSGKVGEVVGDEDMERGRGWPTDRGPDVAVVVPPYLPVLPVGVQQVT